MANYVGWLIVMLIWQCLHCLLVLLDYNVGDIVDVEQRDGADCCFPDVRLSVTEDRPVARGREIRRRIDRIHAGTWNRRRNSEGLLSGPQQHLLLAGTLYAFNQLTIALLRRPISHYK